MLRALAEAGAVLGRNDYLSARAQRGRSCLGAGRGAQAGWPGEGWRLLRSYKDGQARFNAYLEDYAFYADGLLALYEATFDPRWFERRRGLAQTTVEQFADEEGGGFFDTSADHETLLTRPKDLYDNATPAGNSVAVDVLLRLAAYTGEGAYRERAERYLSALAASVAQHPAPSGACSPRWTSPSARCRRWPWWATRPGPIRAVSGGALLPLRSQPGAGAAPAWGGGGSSPR